MAQPETNAPIAQRIERLTPIQKAVGSIPTRRAKGDNMQIESILYYSNILNKDIRVNIYGTNGQPILAFPTQDSKANNYESFGLINEIANYINNEQIQVFVVDSIDEESWSSKGEKSWASARQEQYFNFITNELVFYIKEKAPCKKLPITFGCSMGANHATICFLRRPDLFDGMLALSGVFNSRYFYGDYMDDNLYNNSPESFMTNMAYDHPYISLYNQKKIIFCIGQGPWEDVGLSTYKYMEYLFHQKNINAWFDYWGSDVAHDWNWWFKQIRYFLPYLLG